MSPGLIKAPARERIKGKPKIPKVKFYSHMKGNLVNFIFLATWKFYKDGFYNFNEQFTA